MTDVGEAFSFKRTAAIWSLAAILWATRMAFTPWVWFGVFLAVYAALGFWLFGGILPPVILAIGCAGSAWLQIKVYRQLNVNCLGFKLDARMRSGAAALSSSGVISRQSAEIRLS